MEGNDSWPWLTVAAGRALVARAGPVSVHTGATGRCELRVGGMRGIVIAGPLAEVRQVRVSPSGIERRDGAWTETLTVLPDRPALVARWRGRGAGRVSLVLPEGASVAFRDELRVAIEAGDGALLLGVDRAASWRVERVGDAHVLSFDVAEAVQLVVAAGGGTDGVRRRVGVLLDDPVLAGRLADTAATRRAARGPVIASPDGEVEAAFEWSRALLTPAAGAWFVPAALAAGDVPAARAALAHLPADTRVEDARAALAHARWLAWTGDAGPALDARDDLRARLRRLAEPAHDSADAALHVTALREGAVLAETLGDADLVALLGSRVRRLVPVHVDCPDPADAAAAVLRAAAAGALAAESAARFVLTTVTELAGWVPDAVRDRVRLAPRIVASLLPFAVRGLPAGESRFDVRVALEGALWRLTVEQTEGAVPATLVVEPWVPAAAFDGVRVDGRAATLDARPLDGGWVLPVQLVADAPRTIEVTGIRAG